MSERAATQRALLTQMLWGGVLVAVPFIIFFGEVLWSNKVYYSGDIARQYLPQRAALDRALAGRTFPWWSAEIGAGYPLLAEGEIGALYPLNWLSCWLFPPDLSLTVSILFHYLIAGGGFYVYARMLGVSRWAAYFGVLVLSFGGFNVAHLGHVSILSVAAWLPWMLALTHGLLRGSDQRRGHWGQAIGLVIVVSLQFLAGHAQLSLLGLVALAAYAVWCTTYEKVPGRCWFRLSLWLGAMTLGVLGAAPQIAAGAELSALSQRAGGVDSIFFTSYSFHPFLLATYLSPFARGNPYPSGSVELMVYVGLLPLVLACLGLLRFPQRTKWFWTLLALVGFFLALGRWNPLYRYLRYVPILNLFRVPARYLYWSGFGLTVLAAFGFDAIRGSAGSQTTRRGWWLVGLIGLLVVAALGVVALSGTESLVDAWRWLPLAILVVALTAILGVRQFDVRVWTVVAFAILLTDLYAYGVVLDGTYNAAAPREEVVRSPAVLSILRGDGNQYRTYTSEEILPVLSVMRESLYPNMALAHGASSANLYLPLVPKAYVDYVADLSPERLNRLNVKYCLIPQVLPVTPESEMYDVRDPFAALPVNTWLEFPTREVFALEIESYLSHSAGLGDGALVAELVVRGGSGRELAYPLRAGIETAEWAYDRTDVIKVVAHGMPPIARSWPARSGFPPEDHLGHSYLANIEFQGPVRLTAVMLRLSAPEAFVRIERIRLLEAAGKQVLLSHLVDLADHSLVYRSEDVAVYRNDDVLPRAYLVPISVVSVTDGLVTLPDSLPVESVGMVDITCYENTQVVLTATVRESSYLVLADLFYPGWEAKVDSEAAPILSVDGVFRAVALRPGNHEIVFSYHPWPWTTMENGACNTKEVGRSTHLAES